jgi:hypothetical protein
LGINHTKPDQIGNQKNHSGRIAGFQSAFTDRKMLIPTKSAPAWP